MFHRPSGLEAVPGKRHPMPMIAIGIEDSTDSSLQGEVWLLCDPVGASMKLSVIFYVEYYQ
jgi:hypothetical protein